MEIYEKISFIFIFSFFSDFQTSFYQIVDFTRIAASNTASDDVTNQVTHTIFNADLLYSFAHFVDEID